MLKKTKIAITLSSLLFLNPANAQINLGIVRAFTDFRTTVENSITALFAANPAVVTPYPDVANPDLELGVVRDTGQAIVDIANQAMADGAAVVQQQTATFWSEVNHNSIWRDIIAAGFPVGNVVIATYYPAVTMNTNAWGTSATAAIYLSLYAGFMPIRFYAQEFGQLSLRRSYNWPEQQARWASFGLSYAMAQVYTSFAMPVIMNKIYPKKDNEELRRRLLLNINVCDPDYLLAMRNQYSQYTTTSGVCGTSTSTTNSNWTYWNNKYSACTSTYTAKATNYTEVRKLFAQNTDTITYDPDPQMLTSTALHPEPGITNLAQYIRDNLTAVASSSGGHILNLPAATVGGIALPSFYAKMDQIYTGSATGYDTMQMTFSVGGKPNVTIRYLKSLTTASYPPAPTVWPPYTQP